MSNLEDIADAKIQAAVSRRLDALTPAMTSIRQEMNGRNLLHSTMTVTKIHEKCILLFDAILDDMKTEYEIVLDSVFWPREALADLLISKARRHFDNVADRTQDEIRGATQTLMNCDMHRHLYNDIAIARDRALTNLSLHIDGHIKIQTYKKIVRAAVSIPKLILGLFKQ